MNEWTNGNYYNLCALDARSRRLTTTKLKTKMEINGFAIHLWRIWQVRTAYGWDPVRCACVCVCALCLWSATMRALPHSKHFALLQPLITLVALHFFLVQQRKLTRIMIKTTTCLLRDFSLFLSLLSSSSVRCFFSRVLFKPKPKFRTDAEMSVCLCAV